VKPTLQLIRNLVGLWTTFQTSMVHSQFLTEIEFTPSWCPTVPSLAVLSRYHSSATPHKAIGIKTLQLPTPLLQQLPRFKPSIFSSLKRPNCSGPTHEVVQLPVHLQSTEIVDNEGASSRFALSVVKVDFCAFASVDAGLRRVRSRCRGGIAIPVLLLVSCTGREELWL
jgi:hypothetical protein